MDTKIKVGFIGIGMMGKPMSKRVLAAGYPLTVYDIRPEPVEELVKAGARKAHSPKEIAETSDVVITSLPSLKAADEIYLGVKGLLRGTHKGQILVETSTVPPSMVRKVADEAIKQGAIVIDAPLLATTTFHQNIAGLKANEVADKGLVTVMVGGDTAVVEKVRPILATFGNPIFHVGPVGAGEMIKVLTNATSHAYSAVACEILGVAAKAGLDLKKLEEIFRNTNARSYGMNQVFPYYLENGTGRQMTAEAAIKDSESMLEIAKDLGVPILMQSVKHSYFQMSVQNGGSKDRAWDGEMMRLWEGIIGRPLRFNR